MEMWLPFSALFTLSESPCDESKGFALSRLLPSFDFAQDGLANARPGQVGFKSSPMGDFYYSGPGPVNLGGAGNRRRSRTLLLVREENEAMNSSIREIYANYRYDLLKVGM